MVRRDEGVVLPQRGSFQLSDPSDSTHFHSGSLQPTSRKVDLEPDSSSKVSRVPTAISREEREEEKEEKVKEEVVVPDTLLASISPDLVSALCQTIPFLVFSVLVFSYSFI